uniref:Uncharacterized protein n=1 Tax=Arion vulgaris TaxID=1028688 RepID=A0A0B7BAY7_9EUPU
MVTTQEDLSYLRIVTLLRKQTAKREQIRLTCSTLIMYAPPMVGNCVPGLDSPVTQEHTREVQQHTSETVIITCNGQLKIYVNKHTSTSKHIERIGMPILHTYLRHSYHMVRN